MNHDRPVVYIGDALWMQGALWAAGEPEHAPEPVQHAVQDDAPAQPAQRCPLCHGAVVAGECQGCGMAMDL